MGRHSGARCSVCQELVRVRDDRLVEHEQEFPALGTSVPCVGSHSRAPLDGPAGDATGAAAEAGGWAHEARPERHTWAASS